MTSDPQHRYILTFHDRRGAQLTYRWLGPEKGVIHLATAAVSNAVFDLHAKYAKKPLWKLIAEFSPEEFVKATCFRYVTDLITPEEALALLKAKEAGKQERIDLVTKVGYPAYTTSIGWLGYSDEKVSCWLSYTIRELMPDPPLDA